MCKRTFTAIAALFLAAGGGSVYAQDARPVTAPDARPATAPDATPAPAPPPAADGTRSPYFQTPGPVSSGGFSTDLEFLLWFFGNSRDHLDLASDAPLSTAGVTLIGTESDAERDVGLVAGGRLSLGYWWTTQNPWVLGGVRDAGIEATFLFVSQASADFRSGPDPILVRPFFDVNDRTESAFVVAAPGIASGNITAHSQGNMWGGEVNAWKNVCCNYPGTNATVDILGGFRYLNNDGQLNMESNSVFSASIPASSPFAPFAGNSLTVLDSFTTHNNFYGGQIGIDAKIWFVEKVCLEACFKLALGVTAEELSIEGNQIRSVPGVGTTVSNGGLFALPSNIGHYDSSKFTPLPEIGFKLSSPVTNHFTASVGFSALYWDRTLRPGLQVDRQIDISQLPNNPGGTTTAPSGLGSPGVLFRQSDLFLMGLSLGLEFKW